MEFNEFISIGRIVGTHGYKGVLKVEPLTDFPQRFKELTSVKVKRDSNILEFPVTFCDSYKGLILMKLSGIESKEEAQTYRNALIIISEEELYPLPEGSYYHFQLEGMEVCDLQRGYLGKLKEIIETGANDVYVIESPQYGEILIPAIKQVISKIDLDNNKMMVELLPGLID